MVARKQAEDQKIFASILLLHNKADQLSDYKTKTGRKFLWSPERDHGGVGCRRGDINSATKENNK